jgi:ketosteroid isomerase-like protein
MLLSGGILYAAQDPKTEKEVLAAMEAFKQAYLAADGAAMNRLIHEDVIYGHSDGHIENKSVFVEGFLRRGTSARFDLSDVIVHIYGDVAVVRALLDVRGSGSADTPFLVNTLNVWAKSGQAWQLVARQATRINPPSAGRGKK